METKEVATAGTAAAAVVVAAAELLPREEEREKREEKREQRRTTFSSFSLCVFLFPAPPSHTALGNERPLIYFIHLSFFRSQLLLVSLESKIIT